jgi:hypothetical protein
MSADIAVIFDHPFDAVRVLTIPALLEPSVAPMLARGIDNLANAFFAEEIRGNVNESWRRLPSREHGFVDPEIVWSAGSIVHFFHPAGVHLFVGRYVCNLGGLMKWSSFAQNTRVATLIRSLSLALGTAIGATKAIYVPTQHTASLALDLMYDGSDLAEIEAWLREKVGPPAPAPDAIFQPIASGGWDPIHYSVENLTPSSPEMP